jgi:hypothetical protein
MTRVFKSGLVLAMVAVAMWLVAAPAAFAAVHEGGWEYPAPPPSPPSLEAHPVTPETQAAYLSSVKVIYDDETGAVTLRFAFFDPAFWSPAEIEFGVAAGWSVGPTIYLGTECTVDAQAELTLYTREAESPHLGTGIALATLTGYTGTSSAPVLFTGENYEATVVNPAFRNRSWRCLNISPSEHPTGGLVSVGAEASVDENSEVELSGYLPTPGPAPILTKSTAWMPSTCGLPPLVQHPHEFSFSCDENAVVTQAQWQHWGSPTATGSGTLNLVLSCTPNCASAPRHHYRVKIEATRITRCGQHRTYSRIVASILGRRPRGRPMVYRTSLVSCHS